MILSQSKKKNSNKLLLLFSTSIILIIALSCVADVSPEKKARNKIVFQIQDQKRYYERSLKKTPIIDSVLVDDRDGQTYRIRQYGNLWWMIDNLNFDTEDTIFFRDQYVGRVSIPYDKNREYGIFYDKIAAKQACPDGWRLPYSIEWQLLNKIHGNCDKEMDSATGSYRMEEPSYNPVWGGFAALQTQGSDKGKIDYELQEKAAYYINSSGNTFFIHREYCRNYRHRSKLRGVGLYPCRCVQEVN